MVLVVVGLGARPRRREVGLRDAELLEGGLEDDAAAKQRLALAGAVDDPWHGPEYAGPCQANLRYAGVDASDGASARITAAASADTVCLAMRS